MSQPTAVARATPTRIVTTLSLCGIAVSLQQTLLLPLLPELPRLLGTTPETASWLVTATLLTGAVATPTVSRLADTYGKRRMLLITLAVSVLGAALGASSELVPLLIAARALQGVGVALIPVAVAIMRDELPRDRLPLGVALMSATLAIGAGIGLPLSGLVGEHLDWHANFWITGVLGSVMFVAVVRLLPESPVRTRGRFDVRGALILTVALTAVLLAISKGSQWGWSAPSTLMCGALGLALLAAWVPLELRTPGPLVDLRVAARRPVLLSNVASYLAGFAMYTNMLVTTQLLQLPASTGFGLDMLASSLWMVPNALAFGLTAPVSAWVTRRAGPATTLLCGAFTMAIAYVGRAMFSDTLAHVVVGSVAVGTGTALVYGAMPTLISRSVPVTETASANGLNMLLRSLGTSTASATIAAVATAGALAAGASTPSHSSLMTMFWLAAASATTAGLVGIPLLRMSELDEEGAAGGQAGSAMVVDGTVLTGAGAPARHAVVTILSPQGETVDWAQADTDGHFTAAVPGPDEYLVVATVEGWRPRSALMRFEAQGGPTTIALTERLRMSGTITRGGLPVADALVVVTRQTGESVTSVRSEADGTYELPRPANGRYVLTALAPDGTAAARVATIWEAARIVDLDLDSPPQREARLVRPSARTWAPAREGRSRGDAAEAPAG